jgi:hypothetical protein
MYENFFLFGIKIIIKIIEINKDEASCHNNHFKQARLSQPAHLWKK